VRRIAQLTGAFVAAGLLMVTAACGPSANTNSSNAPANSAGAAPAAGGTKRATLKLTGTWSYDGEFSGHLVCFHEDDTKRFEFEGQQPYLVDIVIEGVQDGTFDIPNYTKVMTGQIHDAAGAPKIRVSRLAKVGDAQALNFAADAGSITIAGSGANGSAKWTSSGNGTGNITAEVHWENCEAAS
jgi:hypothetical protein